MRITKQQLIDAGACPEQVVRFVALFGDSANVTIKACVEHARTFDWHWAAGKLLTATALAAYDKTAAPALAAYNKAVAGAFARAYNSQENGA